MTPSTLDPSLASHLRTLRIGVNIPRKRSRRGGRRQRKIVVITSSQQYTSASKHPASKAINFDNLISVSLNCSSSSRYRKSASLTITAFSGQSVGKKHKRSAINDFIVDQNVDLFCLTESWFRPTGDEPKCHDLSPPGYKTLSFPSPSRGGGIALVISDSLSPFTAFLFDHSSFELVQMTPTLPQNCIRVFCLYRPPPSKKNKLSDSLFPDQFADLLEYINSLTGKPLIVGDFNFHYDCPTYTYTAQLIELLHSFSLQQLVTFPTHRCDHILDWIIVRKDDNILKSVCPDHTLPSDHCCVLSHLAVSVPPPRPVYVVASNISAIDITRFKSDLQALLCSSPFLTADQLDQLLKGLLDQHAPATSRKSVPRRSPSPWLPAVAPELRAAKRERRKAERRWLKSGLTDNNPRNQSIHLRSANTLL